jgi:hypothetical protein
MGLLLVHSAALAEKRMALLIGNEAYARQIGQLANPHNDVALLEQTLKGLGFEVDTVRDAGLGALTRAINAYSRRLQAAGPHAIGFFYYSGHGASDGSTNYLIPVDVRTTETGELWDQSLQLAEITRKLKRDASNATHFVVFDACRNTLKLTQPGSRAVVQSKGFVPVAQENGMLIAYATAEGELASDVGAGAGPYAKVLAEEVVKPGIEAVAMFRVVQRRVRAAIRQEPYLGFSALGDVYLAGEGERLTVPPAAPLSGWSTAEREWQQYGKDTKDIHLLEAFKDKYKADPVYVRLAEARIEELKKQQVVVATPPPAPTMALPPGVMIDNLGPPRMQQPPSAARAQLPPPVAAVTPRPAPQPPVRISSAANMPPPAEAEPVTPAASTASGAGYVTVLSSQKSRMDALKIFANMQETYGELLSSRKPDVQEANLGEKGVWYRLVVGPPGSREAAASLCTQLKAAGYSGLCWVTVY